MMRRANIQMTTVVKKAELLTKLRENMAAHARIVREAREGYVKAAKARLTAKLDEVEREARQGKLVALSFSLAPPQDYSQVYATAIKMLEMNVEDTVTLAADEFRQMVEDEWDFTDNFLHLSSAYSATARITALSKSGGGVPIPTDDDDGGGGAAFGDSPVGGAPGN